MGAVITMSKAQAILFESYAKKNISKSKMEKLTEHSRLIQSQDIRIKIKDDE